MNYPLIIGTVGQPSANAAALLALAEAGLDAFRFNFGPGLGEIEQRHRLQLVRDLSPRLAGSPRVLVDLPLPRAKVRLGMLPQRKHWIEKDKLLTLRCAAQTTDLEQFVPLDADALPPTLKAGAIVSIGDGELALEIVTVEESAARLRAINSGWLPCVKSLNCGYLREVAFDSATVAGYLRLIHEFQPEIVALSFVESKADIERCRNLVRTRTYAPQIAAKIETRTGIANMHEIVPAADLVIFARGDLGLNITAWEFGAAYANLRKACAQIGRPFVVATQIIESLESHYVPRRSELSDLWHHVSQGVDGFMLAKETSATDKPAQAVRYLRDFYFNASKLLRPA